MLLRKVHVKRATLIAGLMAAAACGSGLTKREVTEPQTCGNAEVEGDEACDYGLNNGNPGACCQKDCTIAAACKASTGSGGASSTGPAPVAATGAGGSTGFCGDGIKQPNEQCDPKDPGSICQCDTTCHCICDCKKAKIFKAVVANNANPGMAGDGLAPTWSYNGFIGVAAGKALCQAVGADHVCSYAEIRSADSKGELFGVPANLTYWLYRTTNAADPKAPVKSCSTNAQCPVYDVCDPTMHVCAFKPGAGGRCNDWTFAPDFVADGEWFELYDPQSPFASGGVHDGSFSYHFDSDPTYDGTQAHTCHDATKLGCAGPCSGVKRAIMCCFPVCCP